MQVLDKGRGIGGRMATRRVVLDGAEISFDHGAQYLRPHDAAFGHMLADAGAVLWQDKKLVGAPGMSALPKALASGLSVIQNTEVAELTPDADQWHLITNTGAKLAAQRVILTIPAPQVLRLLGKPHPFAPDLARVTMAPCLTLMAAFDITCPRPFSQRLDPDHPLAWIAQDSTKPARSMTTVTWVAQAGPKISAKLLDLPPEASKDVLLPHLCDVLGLSPSSALYASVHRWRYAQTVQPLGVPFLCSSDRRLYVGGDWTLGPLAEHGWKSGRAIAADILGQGDVV